MSFKIKKKKYIFIRGPGEKLVSVLQCKLTPNAPSFSVQGRSSASMKPGSLTIINQPGVTNLLLDLSWRKQMMPFHWPFFSCYSVIAPAWHSDRQLLYINDSHMLHATGNPQLHEWEILILQISATHWRWLRLKAIKANKWCMDFQYPGAPSAYTWTVFLSNSLWAARAGRCCSITRGSRDWGASPQCLSIESRSQMTGKIIPESSHHSSQGWDRSEDKAESHQWIMVLCWFYWGTVNFLHGSY